MRALFIAALSLSFGAQAQDAALQRKIESSAIDPITKSSYPKLYAAWGEDWVKRLNDMQPRVALKVAASSSCDRVEIIGLSDVRSVPRKTAVFFVDCANGKRYYVTDAELATAGPAASKDSKTAAISDSAALESCEAAIKKQLAYPLSFSRHFLNTSIFRAKVGGGNIAVDFMFDAKNQLGAELPMKAHCIIDDQGLQDAIISNN